MPAKSKKQQRFFGMVHAYQKGELKDAPKSVKKAAKSMTKKAAKDFAETKHKGLPEKVKENDDVDFNTDKNWRDRYGMHEEPKTAMTPDMTLDQLQQELEHLEAEYEEAVLAGEESETLDELEAEMEQLQAMIANKEQDAGVNVVEDFKSLTFKEYVEIDEGAWDFVKGAGREVARKAQEKIAAYGKSGLGGTLTDIWQAGKEASAAGQAAKVIQAQLSQLMKLAQTPGGQAALKAALTPQAAPAAAPAAAKAAPTTPVKKAPAPKVGGVSKAFQSKPRYVPGQHGPELQFAGLETPVLGQFLTDGVLDFAKGAGKALGQKVAQSAPVRAGREVIQAGRQASAAADSANFAKVAQGVINTIRNTPNGAALTKQLLGKMGALGQILAQYLQQLSKAAPAGA